MRKLLTVLFCILSLLELSYGQKIEIGSDGVKYNSQLVSGQTTEDQVTKIFGVPDKKTWLPGGTAWTYNKLGIKLSFNTSANLLSEISACYKIYNFEQYPTSSFNGTIIVFGKILTKTTPISSFKNIPQIKFDGTNNQYITVASISGGRICWSKSTKPGVIDGFSVSF